MALRSLAGVAMPFHLLVVEDSTADTRLIRLGVARCPGCTTAFAEDGDIALAVLRRVPPYDHAARPDLILLASTSPGSTDTSSSRS